MSRPIPVPIEAGSPEWHAWRRAGYGASDAPVLLSGGEKAWRELHAVKLGLIDDVEATEQMEWGRVLEQTIARAYAERTGEPVQKVPPLVHGDLPMVRASLDRRRRRGRVAVELKAWGFKTDDFGPDGSEQVPERIYAQVQQQLAVTGWDRADVAVLFGATKRLEVYRLGRDEDLIHTILALEAVAWTHVEAGRMPPWPGPAETRPILRGDELEADDELRELVDLQQRAQAGVDEATAVLDAIKGRLRARLDEYGGTRGALPDGRRFSVAYRPSKDRVQTAWEHVAAGYRKRLLQLGVTAEELDATTSALTVVSPGIRPLRVTVTKPKETTADAA